MTPLRKKMSSRGAFQFTTWLVWSKHVTPKAAKKDRFDLFGSLLQILRRQGSIFVCGPLHHYVQLFIIFWPVYPKQTIPNNVYWVYWVIGSVSFSFRSFQSVVFETFNSMEATVNFSLLSVFFLSSDQLKSNLWIRVASRFSFINNFDWRSLLNKKKSKFYSMYSKIKACFSLDVF